MMEKIRAVSEGDGPLHAPAKALLILAEEGPRELMYQIGNRLSEAGASRMYLRSLKLTGEEKRWQREEIFPERHTISILVPLYNTPEDFLKEMIRSVQDQTYGGWELCLADGSDGEHGYVGDICRKLSEGDSRIHYRKLEKNEGISENTNACLEMATGDYIALFDHDDILRENALYEVMKAVCGQGADFIYSDELVFASPDRKKIIGYHFKPDFSEDDLLSNNYICHLTVFRASLLEKTGRFRKEYDGSQDHDLVLRLTDEAEKIVHIPKILYEWRSHQASVAGDISSKTYAVDAGLRAVRDHLAAKGIAAVVANSPVYPTMYRITWPLDGTPKISIIADDRGDPEGTAKWLEDVIGMTGWPAVEAVMATGNRDAKAGSAGQADIIPVFTEKTGRAARLNAAAEKAGGDALLFLENGLRPEDNGWAEELLRQAMRPEIGAVGGKVLSRQGYVRHAGIILGMGRQKTAGRGHYRTKGDSAGYFGQLAMAEEMSAVSAETMMVRKELFEEAGGFSEDIGGVLFDADLCLKLREKGYRIIYTPYAVTRADSDDRIYMELGRNMPGYEEACARFRGKWKKVLEAGDPMYNPNLSTRTGNYHVKRRAT